MRMVYLVGLNHKYQVAPACCYIPLEVSESESKAFCKMLREAVEDHNIKGIAEEMSLEGLRTLQGVEQVRAFRKLPVFQDLLEPVECDSIGFNLAKELGLIHRYCDPDTPTREARNLKTPQDREEYWIEQLRDFAVFPALFLLGADHVFSFTKLLKGSGFQPFVLAANWEPSPKL